MKTKLVACFALLLIFAGPAPVWAGDLRAEMEGANTRWLAAYNTNNPAAFPAMYTKDAILMPPGSQPINGADAIGQFWEKRLKPGNRKDHTFEIVSIQQDGAHAHQVNRWTAVVVKDTGEPTKLSGNSVRIFERQADGTWLIKVHIFNVD